MDMGVILYVLEKPYVYKNPVLHSFYVVAMEPRVRKYVVRDHPFQHLLASPLFDPDVSYTFLLSWLYPDFVHHPFDFMHGGPVPAQRDGQAVQSSFSFMLFLFSFVAVLMFSHFNYKPILSILSFQV
ncbi:hypothetical protein AHAS_Ahas05G0162300 [Arachis hypogaea]